MAVGNTTRRFVPNAVLIDMLGSIPEAIKTQYWTGAMMKHPPTPSNPEANPTPIPVIKSAKR